MGRFNSWWGKSQEENILRTPGGQAITDPGKQYIGQVSFPFPSFHYGALRVSARVEVGYYYSGPEGIAYPIPRTGTYVDDIK